VLLLPAEYHGGSPLTFGDWLVVKTLQDARGFSQRTLAQGVFDAKWRTKDQP
jgi:hypothetical protein